MSLRKAKLMARNFSDSTMLSTTSLIFVQCKFVQYARSCHVGFYVAQWEIVCSVSSFPLATKRTHLAICVLLNFTVCIFGTSRGPIGLGPCDTYILYMGNHSMWWCPKSRCVSMPLIQAHCSCHCRNVAVRTVVSFLSKSRSVPFLASRSHGSDLASIRMASCLMLGLL